MRARGPAASVRAGQVSMLWGDVFSFITWGRLQFDFRVVLEYFWI